MGNRRNIVNELKCRYDPVVLARDGRACVLCGSVVIVDVHEILSKSQFGTPELEVCIQPKNMVALCRYHHNLVQGSPGWSGYLLRKLEALHGYSYDEEPFRWVRTNEWLANDDDAMLELYL
jgi:hypothetical protein